MYIYADHASTTPVRDAAVKAMTPYLSQIYGNPSSFHREGQKASEALYMSRKTIASLLGCRPDELIFTSGGSEADVQALVSAAEYGYKIGKKHIVSTQIEHHAVLRTLGRLQALGFEVTLAPVDENGIVDADRLLDAVRDDTCLVSVMYANNEIGTIQPVEKIGLECRRLSVPFHTDAVQAVGHMHIDVGASHIDMLSASAHKFGGPKGVGFLYSRRGSIPAVPVIFGGPQENGRRAGTENVPGAVGMAAALGQASDFVKNGLKRVCSIRDLIISGLSRIPGSVLNGDAANRLCGNISFCFEGIEAEALLLALDQRGICASSGSACTSGAVEPSHVLTAIGRPRSMGALRLTVGEDITERQAEYIVGAVTESVAFLRGVGRS